MRVDFGKNNNMAAPMECDGNCQRICLPVFNRQPGECLLFFGAKHIRLVAYGYVACQFEPGLNNK